MVLSSLSIAVVAVVDEDFAMAEWIRWLRILRVTRSKALKHHLPNY